MKYTFGRSSNLYLAFLSVLDIYGTGIAQFLQTRATGWKAGVWFQVAQNIFLYSKVSRIGVVSTQQTQPLVQWVPGAHSQGLKRPGREADHSPSPSTKVKNTGAARSFPLTPSLIEYRKNNAFTFTGCTLLSMVKLWPRGTPRRNNLQHRLVKGICKT
jgi:hypothetical protein